MTISNDGSWTALITGITGRDGSGSNGEDVSRAYRRIGRWTLSEDDRALLATPPNI